MLDAFLTVVYDHELRQSESVKLANVLSTLPEEDLRKLASGEAKLSFAECSPDEEGRAWLEKYKGTPLFDQALALEKAELELEVAQTAQHEQSDAIYRTRDQIRLQKKMLDLDLVAAQRDGSVAPTKGPEQPMAVVPNDEAQGAGAPGDAGPDAEPQKLSFAITEKGHKFDAALNEMRSRHAAEIQALRDHFTGGRFGLEDEAKAHIQAQGGAAPKGAGERLLNLIRFGVGDLNEGDGMARHYAYTAQKHREGSNAWNPFGGLRTPTKYEVGGTKYRIGAYKSNAPEMKEASARFVKAAISGGLIDKAVVNTIAKGGLTPARAAKAKALGDKVLAKGSKMVGNFGPGGQVLGAQAGKGLALARQGAHLSDLMDKLGSNMLNAALSIAKANPKLVGAGIGAGVGALAGGKDNRLGGALVGAGLGAGAGAAAKGIGMRMSGPRGKSFTDATASYVKSLANKARGAIGKAENPTQYSVMPKPPLPENAPLRAHAMRALDRLDAARGRVLPGKNNVQRMKAAARFYNAARALEV